MTSKDLGSLIRETRSRRTSFLITGGVNSQTESVVKQIYSQMPEPKVVVAVGICACTGGVFKECYNIKGGN